MDTSIVRTRAAFRSPTSSLQKNNFANQFLYDIDRLFESTNDNSSLISSNIETCVSLNSELQSRISKMENALSFLATKI